MWLFKNILKYSLNWFYFWLTEMKEAIVSYWRLLHLEGIRYSYDHFRINVSLLENFFLNSGRRRNSCLSSPSRPYAGGTGGHFCLGICPSGWQGRGWTDWPQSLCTGHGATSFYPRLMDRPAALTWLEVLSHVHTESLKRAPQHGNLYHDIIKGTVQSNTLMGLKRNVGE